MRRQSRIFMVDDNVNTAHTLAQVLKLLGNAVAVARFA